MHPLLFGLLCGLAASCLSLTYRALMVRGADPWAVAWGSLIAGGLLIVPFVDLSGDLARANWDGQTVAIFVCTQMAWAIMTFFDARAYTDLAASINAILNALRLVIIVLVGVFVFGEEASPLGLFGAAVVIGGIVVGVQRSELGASRGARDRGIAVLAAATAISCDKFLVSRLPIDLVLIAGYFVPAALLALVRPGVVRATALDIPRFPALYLAVTVFSALAGWALVYGFAHGQLWTTSALRHAEIVFTFVLAVIFLGERERLVGRGVGAALTLSGAALVAFAHG